MTKYVAIILAALALNACMGGHIYYGADESRLEDMTILLRLKGPSKLHTCPGAIFPTIGRTLFTTIPLEERFKDLPIKAWNQDRPHGVSKSRRLPIVKDYKNKIEMVECEVCALPDRDIVWEEIKAHCSGGVDLSPFPF